ncbi:MAG: hypothetical protein M4579_002224 [Chaenotheca gracillima]|nr:MAG: hypothetical protein M4579_002224 [Chaenotheca gracillima]
MYLLTVQDPSTIILSGDSAGGGMVVSMLVTLRDQGIPLPAGAILISPWVDLTHSFPSVAGDSSLDYIPAHGFLQRPSAAWPPPTSDDMLLIAEGAIGRISGQDHASRDRDSAHGVTVHKGHGKSRKSIGGESISAEAPAPEPGQNLSINLDGNLVEIKDQIQMYATNQLISHPLVSPVLQPSLGGLPPLLILTGGGEMLRDEQIYLAHKAANPAKYPPGDLQLDADPKAREALNKWKGTDVQLQLWDDCCHVTPTLSFTRPAKYMYRSIAQFGAWALAHAQKTDIEILDDDDVSIISSDSSSDSDSGSGSKESNVRKNKMASDSGNQTAGQVGKAGDPLPPFRNHMIRERVDRHGAIFQLAPASSLPALQMPPNDIGVIKQGPVRKWMAAKKEWDTKFARQKRAVQKQRAKEMAAGYDTFAGDDAPPPSALAGRRRADMPKEQKKGRSIGMSLWSLWGSSHDEKTLEREEKADRQPETTVATSDNANDVRSPTRKSKFSGAAASRSRSRRRTVTDAGQVGTEAEDVDENTPAGDLLARKGEAGVGEGRNFLSPTSAAVRPSPSQLTQDEKAPVDDDASASGAPVTLSPTSSSGRPHNGVVAYPFKLAHEGERNASTMTLTSVAGTVPARSQSQAGTVGSGEERMSSIGGSEDKKQEGEEWVATEQVPERPQPERFLTAHD